MGIPGFFSRAAFHLCLKNLDFILMARASYFSSIFGNSPVTPLQKHIDSVVACVEMLPPYFDAMFAGDWDEAAGIQGQIAQLENVSDAIKNELRMNLPTSLFMPIDRRDVLDVLDLQDLIANKTKDIAGLILGRKMAIPAPLKGSYMNFLTRCIDATRQAQVAINELDELVVTDTIPLAPEAVACRRIRQLSVSALLAESIRRVALGESLSSMFVD